MAQVLLVNPKARRKSRKKASPAQLAARAAFAAAARARAKTPARAKARRTRRVNRSKSVVTRVVYRNPAVKRQRRRRNPIGGVSIGSMSSYIKMLKEGVIGGAGAVAVDVAYGYVQPYLPSSLQRVPGSVGIGDAIKAVLTIAAGKLLQRPTRGLSMRAAEGALTVQAHGLLASLLPSNVTVGRVGYYNPARVVNSSTRVGPNRYELSRYAPAGVTPMLNRYTPAYQASPLLSNRDSAMQRQGFLVR